ncbi:hypothetical protein LUZ60_017679 [Juncus effusus]|nr:hypothetical protein LUZ60_017679 [Juncus effusus]
MGDHVVLNVETPTSPQQVESSNRNADVANQVVKDLESGDESDPLISAVECRICQEEDLVKNLETPCACNGSLKYAHRACVQRWCNEKGDITCEICHQPYKPDYTAPPRAPPDETIIEISPGGWTLNGAQLDLRDPRVLAMVEAQRNFLEEEYDEYTAASTSSAAFCRSIVLILMALLLLRHTLSLNSDSDGDDDASTLFSLFLLKAAGFLLPCYIMAWALSILQRQRQRQEATAATLVPADMAFILQSSQARPLQFNVVPEPVTPTSPQHGPSHQ